MRTASDNAIDVLLRGPAPGLPRVGRKSRLSIGVLAALLLSGCSPGAVLNRLIPAYGVEITNSIPYGDGARRTLDVYRPKSAAAAPVVVFFYGGAWQAGSKQLYRYIGTALARRGFVIVVPDYRIYPETRYPGFLEDGARAVRWVKDNAARFGGDPEKLFVMGHSAGAHIAAMLAIDARWLGQVRLAPQHDIAGLIEISGPYDFLPLRDPTLVTIFGGADVAPTQPIFHVSSGAPPALLLTGARDKTVDAGNTLRLAARLRSAGNEAEAVVYPRIGHYAIVAAFAWPLRFFAPVLRDADAFIRKTVAEAAAHPHGAMRAEVMP